MGLLQRWCTVLLARLRAKAKSFLGFVRGDPPMPPPMPVNRCPLQAALLSIGSSEMRSPRQAPAEIFLMARTQSESRLAKHFLKSHTHQPKQRVAFRLLERNQRLKRLSRLRFVSAPRAMQKPPFQEPRRIHRRCTSAPVPASALQNQPLPSLRTRPIVPHS